MSSKSLLVRLGLQKAPVAPPPPPVPRGLLDWVRGRISSNPAPPVIQATTAKGILELNTDSASPLLLLLVVSFAALALGYWILFVPPKRLNHSINNVRVIPSRFPGLGAVGFFANRYTFLSQNATKDPSHPHHGIAKFNLFGKIVYHVGGTDKETIRAIANNKDLSFSQGNNFLFAGIAGAKQKGLNEEGEMDAEEKKEMRELAKAISPKRLQDMAPIMVRDALQALEEWKITGTPAGKHVLIDLQHTYYPLIFKYTTRLMGMTEFAEDPKALRKLIRAFWDTQMNAGFWTTLVPWLPQPRLLKRIRGALTLWSMVHFALKARVRDGRREDDYAQTLLDRGYSNGKISRFVIGGLIAGILNTIGTGAYTLAYIGADQELLRKCRAEVEQVCKKSADGRGERWEDLTTDLEKLQHVTIEEWEEGCETILLCFRESIRLLLTNSLNRYYPGPSKDLKGNERPRLSLYGHLIEDDVYVVFSPPSNLHDADAFPDPFRFDPYRYKRGQGLTEYTFVGWGVGNHRCTGIRFAKLETLIAIATFLLANKDGFVTVNDKNEPYDGKKNEVPLPDLSQLHWRKPRKPMRLRINAAPAEGLKNGKAE